LNSKKSETHIPDAPKSKHAFFHNSILNNEYYFDKRFCSLSKLIVKSKNISFDAPNIKTFTKQTSFLKCRFSFD